MSKTAGPRRFPVYPRPAARVPDYHPKDEGGRMKDEQDRGAASFSRLPRPAARVPDHHPKDEGGRMKDEPNDRGLADRIGSRLDRKLEPNRRPVGRRTRQRWRR
jgi:hypothetical protein